MRKENKWIVRFQAAVQLHTKLQGSKEEVEKAATSILQTGLSV